MSGQTLGHYRVHEELSRGGMGIVYRATDTRLNRDVALKVLPDDLTDDADRRRRFLKEAQAASALEHPHIAVIHEADEVDGRAFIAMELIRGDKISDLLKRGRLPVARTLELAAEAAAGLARAHDKGVIHRDLKPANVMVTDEGHAKIIDFGIAKLIEFAAEHGATKTSHDTAAGVVVGTMTYMSPEQARGDVVDLRSDIFSFGIMLHEMLAGEPPFRGKTGIETASAILHHAAPRLPALGPSVMSDVSADIQRIVDKCLAKDPADRYQGMKDLAVDLRAARRRLDTATHAAPVVTGRMPRPIPRLAMVAAAVAGITVVAGIPLLRSRAATSPAPADATGKPSVAVLYFDNTSGDKELDWMRTGITEMVVTDLSQSSDIEVVGTDRLYGILAELNRQDDRVLTPEVINTVAARTGVDRVVVGSYMKSGESIRINVRLQDAKTGRIESSERVEGAGAGALFAMIDDLSRRIRTKFEGVRAGAGLLTQPVPQINEGGLDRGLGDVTTSSIEAYRLYAEGINLHERYREREAAALFERAVAIDPAFAVAYAKLAVVQSNMGRFDLREKYASQALKLADRLTPRERFYIEGFHYSGRPQTLGRAIDAYKKCADFDPGSQGCRHNLGLIYLQLERYPESIEQYQELVRRSGTYAITYQNMAFALLASGDGERGLDVLNGYLKRNPESAAAHTAAGGVLLGLNRPEDAVREFAQAVLLDANEPNPLAGRALAELMREDWTAAAASADTLWKSADQTPRWMGARSHYALSLFNGRGAEALQWAQRTAAAYSVPGTRSGEGHVYAATVLMAQGRAELAVKEAQQAVTDTKGRPGEPAALSMQARALSAARRGSDAAAAIATLTTMIDPLATARDQRGVNVARGLAALVRGEPQAAIKPLEDAQAALTPRTGALFGNPQHVLIWSALGQAYFESGRADDALPWLEKAAAAGLERISNPIPFVRSFYYLGRIYEQQGNAPKAREAYRRFVGYWKDGDLDRDRVHEAQRKISS
ncbi:MAG: protein kinase [Cyanobacteria bacterium]|nr:protein kinase [Cyanobacteriota bacterium]